MRRRLGLVAIAVVCSLLVTPGASGAVADPDVDTVYVDLDPGGIDEVTVFFRASETDDPEERVRRLARLADVPVESVATEAVTTGARVSVNGRLTDTGKRYRATIETDLGERTGVLTGEAPMAPLSTVAPTDSPTFVFAVAPGTVVEPGDARSRSLWVQRYDLRSAPDGRVTYRFPTASLGLLAGLLVGAFLGPFFVTRTVARRASERDRPLVDRVHTVRRTNGNVVLVATALAGLAAVWFGAVSLASYVADWALPSTPAVGWWTTTLWFSGLVPFVGVAWLAVTLATAPVLRELRDLQYGRRRILADWAKVVGYRIAWYWLVAAVMLTLASQVLDQPLVGGLVVGLLVLFRHATGPLVVRALNDTEPIDGDLREDVDALCSREGVGVRGVSQIATGETVAANGLAAGVAGYRWVFLTEDLLAECDRDEVLSVVAHELGHLQGRHHLQQALFTAGYWTVAFAVYATVATYWLTLAVFGWAYFYVAMGWLAHRHEYQADDYAATATSPSVFESALERLATVNFVPRDTGRSFDLAAKHPSFDERLERLRTERGDDDEGTRTGQPADGADDERKGDSEGDDAAGVDDEGRNQSEGTDAGAFDGERDERTGRGQNLDGTG